MLNKFLIGKPLSLFYCVIQFFRRVYFFFVGSVSYPHFAQTFLFRVRRLVLAAKSVRSLSLRLLHPVRVLL